MPSSIVSQISHPRPTAVIRYPKSWVKDTFKALTKNKVFSEGLSRFYEEIDKEAGNYIWLKQTPDQFNALSYECHQDLAYRTFGEDDMRLEGTWLPGSFPIKKIQSVSEAIREACNHLPEYFQITKLRAGGDIPDNSEGWYVA